MTELEKVVVNRLMRSGMIKFYARYVDDTLLLVKPADVDGFCKNSTASTRISNSPLKNSKIVFLTFSISKFTKMASLSFVRRRTPHSL